MYKGLKAKKYMAHIWKLQVDNVVSRSWITKNLDDRKFEFYPKDYGSYEGVSIQ